MPAASWKPDHACNDCGRVTYTGPGRCPYCTGRLEER